MLRQNSIATVLLVVIAFFVLYPLIMLVYGSFKGGPPGEAGPFTLDRYRETYTNRATYHILFTTVWLSVIRTFLALGLAVFLAWVVTRTDTPLRNLLEVLVWIKFFMPSLPLVIAWILLGGETGFINQLLMKVFNLEEPILDIYSYWGIIWVSTLAWAAVIFILITPAFRGMDAALEESSRMSGANTFTTIRRITLPVLMPSILGAALLTFIRLLESFEVELFLGYGVGIYVYTTKIWWLLGITPADYPQALAMSTVFLVVVFFLFGLQWKLLSGKQFVTITGRGFATRPTKLGKWRYVTLGLILLYFFLAVVLPLSVLALGTFMRVWGVFVPDPYTLKHWTKTLADERFLASMRNTMYVALGAATVGMILYSFISYLVVRSKYVGKHALDFVSWLPWAVPSLVLALGFLWAYVGGLPFLTFISGTIWVLMLVFLVRGLPLGVRTMNGAMMQLGNELEESSRVLGGSWLYTFRRIVAPLVSPAFVATWIILFMLSIRDLVTVIFLYTPKSRVLATILYEHWMAGEYERATVVGLILAVVAIVISLAARQLGRRSTQV